MHKTATTMKTRLITLAAVALMAATSCEGLEGLFGNDVKWGDDMTMQQHQYQIDVQGEAGFHRYWHDAYASFIETWPANFKSDKEPALVFSNRQWFPADYGAPFWSDYDLDNKDEPGGWPIAHFDYDSHSYTKTPLEDGSFRIEVGFLGYNWSGILKPGEDCNLSTPDGEQFHMRYLPPKEYDHSLDDLLEVAHKNGKKRH